jgi:hypothetical protein
MPERITNQPPEIGQREDPFGGNELNVWPTGRMVAEATGEVAANTVKFAWSHRGEAAALALFAFSATACGSSPDGNANIVTKESTLRGIIGAGLSIIEESLEQKGKARIKLQKAIQNSTPVDQEPLIQELKETGDALVVKGISGFLMGASTAGNNRVDNTVEFISGVYFFLKYSSWKEFWAVFKKGAKAASNTLGQGIQKQNEYFRSEAMKQARHLENLNSIHAVLHKGRFSEEEIYNHCMARAGNNYKQKEDVKRYFNKR